MREMKDSGIEWIGEIPEDWKVSRIKQLFSEVNDRCENSENYTLLSVSEYYGVAPKSERISDDDMLTHAETLDGYKICKENDLVMNIMLAWKRAMGVSEYTGIVSPAYCIYRGKQNMCAKYFHYLFRTDMYANLFKQYSTGIIDSRLRLYPDKFFALKCQVPPVDKQHRIADYLDRKCSQIDAIIARQQEVIEKLKAYKLSVITEAVTKGLNPDVPMKDSGVEWIGQIPQFTTVTCARHLYEIVLGKMLSSTPKSEEDTLESYFCAANIHFSDIDYTNLKTMWFSKEERRNYLVNTGDLLVVEGGAGAGGAHIVEKSVENCYIQNSIMIARSISSASNKWLYYTLYSLVKREYIDFVCNKATIPHFTKDKLGNTPVVLFPREIEETIIAFLDEKCSNIDKLIFQKTRVIEKLTDYKKSLIYEVVTGKKEV